MKYLLVIVACAFACAVTSVAQKVTCNIEDHACAVISWTERIKEEPWNPPLYRFRGDAYNELGKFDLAIADYSKAIELNPKYAPVYVKRASLHLFRIADGQQGFELALADLNKSLELDPKNAAAYDVLGRFYLLKTDLIKARENYTRAIALDPDKVEFYFHRALVQESTELAIADYSKAIALDPKRASLYGGRGFALKSKGDYAGAILDFSKAIDLSTLPRGKAHYYSRRGLAYYEKGAYKEAIDDFSKCIELNPNHSAAYQFRSEVYTKLGMAEKAEADRRKYEELEKSVKSQ